MTQIESPTISIIVPVYNTEQYIHRCLMSISESTFVDYEVIVVDDGSTDGTPKICDAFAHHEERFHVIHTENYGVSHARNVGLDRARGKYIVFVDADDEIGKSRMDALMQAEPCDLVFCKYTNVVGDNRNIVSFCDFTEVSINDYRDILNNNINRKPAVVWNGCYLRKTIEDNALRFDENKRIGEDILFNLSYLECCQTIVFINNCDYFHNNIKSSLVNRFYPNNTDHEEEELKAIEHFCKKENLRNRFYIWHKTILYYEKWQDCEDRQIRKAAKREAKKSYNNKYFRESIPFIRKHGSLDERIETYLMGYYRHQLFVIILKILKLFNGLK